MAVLDLVFPTYTGSVQTCTNKYEIIIKDYYYLNMDDFSQTNLIFGVFSHNISIHFRCLLPKIIKL